MERFILAILVLLSWAVLSIVMYDAGRAQGIRDVSKQHRKQEVILQTRKREP